MKYDLAIIGGGPAGLMAANRAGELGGKVIVLEKNQKPGIKLLITGGGRCNFTNTSKNLKTLAACYAPNGSFLISALARFSPQSAIDYFENNGVTTKTEKGGRVFPQSDKAQDILNTLIRKAKELGVEIRTEAAVKILDSVQGRIEKIILNSGEEIIANSYLLATGGRSYPKTGSDGASYSWLKKMGHTIITPRPALVSLQVKENFILDLEGLSLENIVVSLFNDEQKILASRGDIVFTAKGISGPAALDISRFINLNTDKKRRLELDLFPDKTDQELAAELQKIFHSGHKLFKNILEGMIAPKLIPILVHLSNIAPEMQANSVTREEKVRLIGLFKKLPLTLSGLGDFEQAMITAGGVDLREVDPKTFKSRVISNLYLAGEILNLTGPTGGFNLQLCWSTGHAAGEASVDKNIIL